MERTSWRDRLGINDAAFIMPNLTPDELRELAEDIREKGLRNKIVLLNGQVLDGINRADALEFLKVELFEPDGTPKAEYFETRTAEEIKDPAAYVVSQNIKRRHLNTAKKQELVAELIKLEPTKSNRAIAEKAKVSDHTVAVARNRLEASAQIAQLSKTIGKDGRARKAPSKPKPTGGSALAPRKSSKPLSENREAVTLKAVERLHECAKTYNTKSASEKLVKALFADDNWNVMKVRIEQTSNWLTDLTKLIVDHEPKQSTPRYRRNGAQ